MKLTRILFLLATLVLLVAVVVSCDSERYATKPVPPVAPLTVTASAVPDTIPLSYALGLYMKPEGGTAPYVAEWRHGEQVVSDKQATTFKPDKVGAYTFTAFVRDGAGDSASVPVTVYAVPLDSIHTPPDTVTVTLPPDTIRIQLPPDTVLVHDTTIVIVNHYDTTVVIKYDTTIHIDTVRVVEHDTTIVIRYDTTYVVEHDTVQVVEIFVDTVYVPVGAIADTACWFIDWQNLSATVQLHNPAGWYRVVGFDRLRKDPKPYDKEFTVTAGGQEFYFSVYGKKYLVEWVGDKGVFLEENATVVIQLKKPEYLGKITGELCQYYLEGCYWWLVPMDPPNS